MRQARVVYIGLGSNLGERAALMEEALRRLDQRPGVRVLARSDLFETAPMYLTDQPAFLNAAARVRVEGGMVAFLEALMQVEAALGRQRHVANGPRTIDLDVLIAGALRLSEPALTLPHPRLHERAFVLIPLVQLAPELVHPTLGQTMRQLLDSCPGQQGVRPAGPWPSLGWLAS